jgi:predicted enzyme related to lactoylglutathione lyase
MHATKQGRRRMIQGLAGTLIFSQDHKKLVPFYRDTIGLAVEDDGPNQCVFASSTGARLLLGTHSEVHGSSREPDRIIPALLADDVRAEYARLKAAGVEFVGEVSQQGPATFVTFRDPEGNLVNLLQFG